MANIETKEIVNEIGTDLIEEVEMGGGSRIGAGGVVAIVTGLVLAIGAGIPLCKKAIAAIKAKKESAKTDDEIVADDDDFEEAEAE